MRNWIDLFENNNLNFREILKIKGADQPVEVGVHLWHVTPASRVSSILTHGLNPRHENLQDDFEPAIYLTTDEWQAVKIAFQLRKALIVNGAQKRNWVEDYVLIRVDTTHLNNSFYKDGYYPTGVYTHQPIPTEALNSVMTIEGKNLLASNWPKFWEKYKDDSWDRVKDA